MSAVASQITSVSIVCSTVGSCPKQRIYQSFESLAFVTGEFPAQMASDAENISIWWRHHVYGIDVNEAMIKTTWHLDISNYPSGVTHSAHIWSTQRNARFRFFH